MSEPKTLKQLLGSNTVFLECPIPIFPAKLDLFQVVQVISTRAACYPYFLCWLAWLAIYIEKTNFVFNYSISGGRVRIHEVACYEWVWNLNSANDKIADWSKIKNGRRKYLAGWRQSLVLIYVLFKKFKLPFQQISRLSLQI